MNKKSRALYPGSFDPITNGHIDLINRAKALFDEVYVAIAINNEKQPLFSAEERLRMINQVVGKRKGVFVDSFDGLMVDYARSKKIQTIIRGLRATSDFDYEFQMALTNRELAEDIDTIFLMPSEKHFYLSSRLIKEIARLRGRASRFVPPLVASALKKQFGC